MVTIPLLFALGVSLVIIGNVLAPKTPPTELESRREIFEEIVKELDDE